MKDCIVIGGGPAGLNATLVLGRARRNVLLIDSNNARNKITRESHGFITRDGVKPEEFRELAHKEFIKYNTIETEQDKVVEIIKDEMGFKIKTRKGNEWLTRKVILATGVIEQCPNVPKLGEFYGNSIFNCPYCDGWELKDQPLALFGLVDYTIHMAGILRNWSLDLIIFTNGEKVSKSQMKKINELNVEVETDIIQHLYGKSGMLEGIELKSGKLIPRSGGFITPELIQASDIGKKLGVKLDKTGGYKSDQVGRTNIPNLFVAGEASIIYPSQLIIAAASGVTTAMAVNVELIHNGILGSKL
ncbi:MAG: NAD(P)/FAD-dependent oxidoreductase [Paenisporosarcina sp.]